MDRESERVPGVTDECSSSEVAEDNEARPSVCLQRRPTGGAHTLRAAGSLQEHKWRHHPPNPAAAKVSKVPRWDSGMFPVDERGSAGEDGSVIITVCVCVWLLLTVKFSQVLQSVLLSS